MIQVTEKNEFHLKTESTSYIIGVLPTGHVGSYFYGKKIREKDDYSNLLQYFSVYGGIETLYNGELSQLSLNQVCLEHSSFGKGDYREAMVHLELSDGSRVTDFVYKSHRVYKGKEALKGLPCFCGEEDQVETLEIVVEDSHAKLEMSLIYNVFYKSNVITRHVEILNLGDAVMIDKASSMNLDMPRGDFDLLSLYGHWISEKHMEREPLRKGITSFSSKRMASSAIHNPFMVLTDRGANEDQGGCYGFSLVYSGNHESSVELSTHDITRVQMGINSFDFKWKLDREETFVTPEVVMTYSPHGLNGMSHNFHHVIRHHLLKKEWQNKERPLLFNSWEAMYFDFNEKKLLNLAKAGKNLGMEMFVLDDGWFKGRNDDTSSLGDWVVDRKKLPNGLKGISRKVKSMGLQFGIWVEPEMISVNSDLYREHKDWAIQVPGREPAFGRNQLVLDMSNPQVVDYLFKALSKVFKEAEADYVKWDLNRNGTDLYSDYLAAEGILQSELSHRYYLGLYDLLNRLNESFPHILFESCASGGNRHDLGMLHYMPQTWISDNTDPGERMYVQYGASLLFPTETMGAHVGSNPSHQLLRNNDIETRFNMAAFGALGYELDLTELSSFEKKAIINQVKVYKSIRKTMHSGRFFRLRSPYNTNNYSFMVVDEKLGILCDFQKIQHSYPGFEQIYLKGLVHDAKYKLETRKHFINVEKFGDLINGFIPVNLSTTGVKGLVHKTLTEHYMNEGEVQEVTGYGDEFEYAGFRPYPQFTGLGYDERTRHMGDFGSRMYLISKMN